jgi:hypothetical protein
LAVRDRIEVHLAIGRDVISHLLAEQWLYHLIFIILPRRRRDSPQIVPRAAGWSSASAGWLQMVGRERPLVSETLCNVGVGW